MTCLIKYLARWLAWQVSDHGTPASPGPARITVFSAEDRAVGA